MNDINRSEWLWMWVVGGLFILFLGACSPAPRHVLSQEEKTADLYWLFSQFKQNYAPLKYKEEKYKFKFEDLKARYLRDAQNTKTNEEFYHLLHRFIAEFHDAHVSGFVAAAKLPNRSQVAYLGFDGVRVGEKFLVKKLLPTISEDSKFPIKEDDEIVSLDGEPLVSVVKKEFIPLRSLGDEEASLTYHFPKLFNRMSLTHVMPKQKTAILKVLREKKEYTFELPWVVKDLYSFTEEQAKASEKAKAAGKETTVGTLDQMTFFSVGLKFLTGQIEKQPSLMRKLTRGLPGFNFRDNFVFLDTAPSWSSPVLQKIFREVSAEKESQTPLKELKELREVPETAVMLKSKYYPAYIWAEPILDKDKKPTGQLKQIGYVYLHSFDVEDAEEAVKEFKANLKKMAGLGVKDIVIDLINNGGGSVNLGLHMAQALSNKRIITPEIQFKLSENWIDTFESQKLKSDSDAESQIAKNIYESLMESHTTGEILSKPWDTNVLMPFSLQPNDELKEDFKVYLLVNEMCASMCDIFAGVLKDNRLATVVGTKSMGAGGNVVVHPEAPNSHFIISQTESLIRRRDGQYLENNGVTPDVAINVNETGKEKYTPVRAKAVELIK